MERRWLGAARGKPEGLRRFHESIGPAWAQVLRNASARASKHKMFEPSSNPVPRILSPETLALGTLRAEWVALLGRRDIPVDGVEDYCTFLGEALAPCGVKLRQVHVNWIDKGWVGALRRLRHESAGWRGHWVLLQYTAMAWSSRGFPFFVLAVLAILRGGGTHVAIVFHEPNRQGGSRWIDRIRGACQSLVIRRLYRRAVKAIFTVPLEAVDWLPKAENKSAFIPIGANIPERVNHRFPSAVDKEKTVIVFGVTGKPATAREVKDIAHVMREASKALARVRLVVVGRGGIEAQGLLGKAFDGSDMQVLVRGILPAEEIASELEGADALLFVRGAVSLRRGSVMAAIACGLPIIGHRDRGLGGPLDSAGVEWSTSGHWQSLARALVRVLTDSRRWTELHERNLESQKAHFGWVTIAAQFCRVLDTV